VILAETMTKALITSLPFGTKVKRERFGTKVKRERFGTHYKLTLSHSRQARPKWESYAGSHSLDVDQGDFYPITSNPVTSAPA
jgi:hypothetical protein